MADQLDRDRRLERLLEGMLTSEEVEGHHGESVNLVEAAYSIAAALQRLGNADAATPMGGLEAHGKAIEDGCEKIAFGLHDVADAIREAGET